MAAKKLSDFSDEELRKEIQSREVAKFKALLENAHSAMKSLAEKIEADFDSVSSEVKKEITDHISNLPDLTNISHGTSLLKAQAKVPQKRRRLTEAEKKKVVGEYMNKEVTANDLAARYGLSLSSIYRWSEKYGKK